MSDEFDVVAARALLEAEGFVVLRAKSYQQAQQRQAIHQREVQWAEREAEHARRWAENCLDEERRLRDRCTHLYGLAASLGATKDQLSGRPTAPVLTSGNTPKVDNDPAAPDEVVLVESLHDEDRQ